MFTRREQNMTTFFADKSLIESNSDINLVNKMIINLIWDKTRLRILKYIIPNNLKDMNKSILTPLRFFLYAGNKAHISLTYCTFSTC